MIESNTTQPGLFSKLWRPILVMLIVIIVINDGVRVKPAGLAHGTETNGHRIEMPPFQTLRVGTFNIHRGVPVDDDDEEMDRTAGSLRQLDLIGLNEVGGCDQTKKLGKELNLRWLFAATERRWWHEHFGNALLTGLPVSRWRRIPLPSIEDGGQRNVLIARIPWNGKEMAVLITHIDWKSGRDAQLKQVIDLFLAQDEPAILMGDLNSNIEHEPRIRQLLDTPGVKEAIRSSGLPDKPGRIDWIFMRGLEPTAAGLIDRKASDHPAVWAEVRLVH